MTEYEFVPGPIPVYCGTKLIEDIFNPRPEEIDTQHILYSLCRQKRFSNDRRALTIHQHRAFVWQLAYESREPKEVLDWAWLHDDHEGVIGDIANSLKFAMQSEVLDKIEKGLDRAIAAVAGVSYPSDDVRRAVKRYDLLAASYERVKVMDQPVAGPEDRWIDPSWQGVSPRLYHEAMILAERTEWRSGHVAVSTP